MKKILIITMMAVTMMACEEKIIDLVIKINESFEYVVSNDGDFEDSYTVTREEVMDEFDYDVASVKDVNIAYLELFVTKLQGNQAERIRASGIFEDNASANPILVFQDFEFTIDDFTGAPMPVSGYQTAGINALAEKLRNYVNDTDATSFTVSVQGVAVDGQGNPVPGQSINLQMSITVDAEVIFTEEATLPSFP